MQKPHRPMTTFQASAFSIFVVALLIFVPVHSYLHTPASRVDCPVTVDGEDETSSSQLSFRANPTNYQSYSWEVSSGEISGPRNTPSITVVNVGTGSSCKATVRIRHNGCQNSDDHTTTVVPLACPTVSVSCVDRVEEGPPITFSSDVRGASVTFNWTVSAGTISHGQGTSSISVDTAGLGGQTVTATVELGGLDPSCSRTASCTTEILARPKARKTDQFAEIRWSAVRARLRSYATQLQNEPGAQGYIIMYGNEHSIDVRSRVSRVREYLVNVLHIDTARLVVVYGEVRQPSMIELWIVPSGASPPSANEAP